MTGGGLRKGEAGLKPSISLTFRVFNQIEELNSRSIKVINPPPEREREREGGNKKLLFKIRRASKKMGVLFLDYHFSTFSIIGQIYNLCLNM